MRTPRALNSPSDFIETIREAAESIGHVPSRREFLSHAGVSEYRVLRHFPSWREALRASGLESDSTNVLLEDRALLEDWGEIVRRNRRIPTRMQYGKEGKYSASCLERHFGPWSRIPANFREFAQDNAEWLDVVALLPLSDLSQARRTQSSEIDGKNIPTNKYVTSRVHNKLVGLPTYGDPIDFRGLRHEPVNEQGVVFLFGMVAKELGYSVEAVQTGYPDCEAKRQVGPGKWQRVRIEFEFESRNFRDHGHPEEGCEVIVCWRDNWLDHPQHIEVLELKEVIKTLAANEDT